MAGIIVIGERTGMARIYPICSSSEGNSTFIGTRGHGILIDAGCSFRMLKNSLEYIGTDFSGIEAVFITHEHIDHVRGLEQIIKHTNVPVFAASGTISALKSDSRRPLPDTARLYDISAEKYHSAAFEVSPIKTSHDAADSVGYLVHYYGRKLAVCTDTGKVTDDMRTKLSGCEAVLLESNYDVEMLRKNPKYHIDLKRRILGEKGHLSNNACAEFAEQLVRGGTKHLILGHLSRENNTPQTAFSCTADHLHRQGLRIERDFTLNIAPVTTDGHFIAI